MERVLRKQEKPNPHKTNYGKTTAQRGQHFSADVKTGMFGMQIHGGVTGRVEESSQDPQTAQQGSQECDVPL
jgi:hypothetical protein